MRSRNYRFGLLIVIVIAFFASHDIYAQNGSTPEVKKGPVVATKSGDVAGTTDGEVNSFFGENEREARAAFDPEGDKEFAEVLTKFNTDWVWGEPGRMTARYFVEKNKPTFMYQFGYVPQAQRQRARFGAGDGSEVSFVFNTLNSRWGAGGQPAPEEKELARIMNTYWANFAKTGNPNGQGVPEWPAYEKQKEMIINIDVDGKPASITDPRKARFNVVEKAFRKRERLQSRGI